MVEHRATKVRLKRETIEFFPDQVNGERSLPVLVEHDPYCMAIGKIKETRVEPFEDEYIAMARIHIKEDARSTIKLNGMHYLEYTSIP